MDYYISKNDGKYIGPFKKDQLIANGLDLDDLVWRQGLSGWIPANQLPELSDIIGDVPPPMEITLGPERAQQPLVQPIQQTTQQSYGTNAKIKTQLEQLNKEKEELKKLLEQKKTEGNKKLAAARTQRKAEITEKKKQEEKKKEQTVNENCSDDRRQGPRGHHRHGQQRAGREWREYPEYQPEYHGRFL